MQEQTSLQGVFNNAMTTDGELAMMLVMNDDGRLRMGRDVMLGCASYRSMGGEGGRDQGR